MKIRELLSEYYGNSGFEQFALNLKLRKTLQLIAETTPTVKFLLWVLDRKSRVNISEIYADKIVELCDLIGISDDRQLLAFDIAEINVEALIQYVDPTFDDIDFGFEVNNRWVREQINNSDIVYEPAIKWQFNDLKYQTLSLPALEKVFSRMPPVLPHIQNTRDCDDYVSVVRGYLSLKGCGNLTIGEIHLNFYDDDDNYLGISHAMNISVLDTGEVRLIEPQTNQIFLSSEMAMNLMNIKKQKAGWIAF